MRPTSFPRPFAPVPSRVSGGLAALALTALTALTACGGGSSGDGIASAGGAKGSPSTSAPEIGLHRSLGATRGQIRVQFLAESALLSALGGTAGSLLGGLVTVGYALARGWPPVVPGWALAGAFAATVCVGVLAGLYPAVRAARLSPTAALSSP